MSMNHRTYHSLKILSPIVSVHGGKSCYVWRSELISPLFCGTSGMAGDFTGELEKRCQEDPDQAPIVPAVKILLNFVKDSNFGSVQELQASLDDLSKALVSSSCATIGVESACQLFKRFITLTQLDVDLQELKPTLVARGEAFLQKISMDRQKVARLAAPFILNGHRLMVHSRSRVVRDALLGAAKIRANFTVYITSSGGAQLAKELKAASESGTGAVETVLIADSAIGYYMERTDLVLLGAEGIVESGGIINRVGTFP
ncbi:translation initiation factor eIF-2B subunit alpha-like, partial [Tropilaelaps mercedesae]